MCPYSQKSFNFLPRTKEVEHVYPSPRPASEYLPTWLKLIPTLPPPYHESPKNCIPFMDTFSHGYIQELACDVEVRVNGQDETGNTIIEFLTPPAIESFGTSPIMTRGEVSGSINLMPKFPGFYRSEQSWQSLWEPHTPEGFSTLYTHPLNRLDLPFITMSGIIDTDVYPVPGPIPFLIKEGFSGIIPAGTPIYQIIFIKREKWKGHKKSADESESYMMRAFFNARKYFQHGYKKLFWQKKSFELS
jgi:hypothetical protein